MPNVTLENLDEVFSYHAPTPDQVERYSHINAAVKELARVLLEQCPPSRERAIAITNLQVGVRMTANMSIALEHLED